MLIMQYRALILLFSNKDNNGRSFEGDLAEWIISQLC